MILSSKQAREVTAEMASTNKHVSFDFTVAGSSVEKIVVHERPKLFSTDSAILVWQQIGGMTHNAENYSSREAFKNAYQ